MNRKPLRSFGLVGICLVALTTVLALSSAGCISFGRCSGARCAQMGSGCKSRCAGKCAGKCCCCRCSKPCKKGDATAKCGPDCKKPCCAKKSEATSDAAAPCHGKTALTAAGAGKPGCSKGCKKPCGAKGAKVAKCGPDCTKPCCAKNTAPAKAAAGR